MIMISLKIKSHLFSGFLIFYLIQGNVFANTIKEYLFEPNKTYPVYTAMGVVTQIELNSREIVKDFGAGLSKSWDLARRENVFYIKPKADAVDTNLIVRTQAHQYIFELKVVKGGARKGLSEVKEKGVNYQIRFRYPDSTNFSVRTNLLSGYSLRYDPSRVYNTNYDVAIGKKSEWLVPLKVYDDGRFTYIHLNKGRFTGDFPTVYGRKNKKGDEFVLNTNVENNIIVVHGTYPFLVLRHGNNVVGLRRN